MEENVWLIFALAILASGHLATSFFCARAHRGMRVRMWPAQCPPERRGWVLGVLVIWEVEVGWEEWCEIGWDAVARSGDGNRDYLSCRVGVNDPRVEVMWLVRYEGTGPTNLHLHKVVSSMTLRG